MRPSRLPYVLLPLLSACATTTFRDSHVSVPAPPAVKADVLMVASLAGADLGGNSEAVPVQGYNDSPAHHIGLSLQDPTLKTLFNLPLKKLADMADAPDQDKSYELAVQYLMDNGMDPDDGVWKIEKNQFIAGHTWGGDGWRPTGGYFGFLVLQKALDGTYQPYSPHVLIDADPTSGKNEKRIHMRFYVNVQPR